MQIILDQIASVMIAGTVILLVLNIQFTAQRASAEQTIAYSARKSTLAFADVFEQELPLVGDGTDSLIVAHATNAAGETTSFQFYRQDGGGNPMLVEYRLAETDTVEINGTWEQLYQLERYEDGVLAGGGPPTVHTFRLTTLDETGTTVPFADARMIRAALVVAYPFGSSEDSYLFQSHWGMTVRPLNLDD